MLPKRKLIYFFDTVHLFILYISLSSGVSNNCSEQEILVIHPQLLWLQQFQLHSPIQKSGHCQCDAESPMVLSSMLYVSLIPESSHTYAKLEDQRPLINLAYYILLLAVAATQLLADFPKLAFLPNFSTAKQFY